MLMQQCLEFYQLTSKGDREVNQDCMANRVTRDYAVFVVADGLGGHHAGEKASQFFCRGLIQWIDHFQPKLLVQPQQAIQEWVGAAVAVMRKLFEDDPAAMNAHTTCAILYLDAQRTLTVHCGDSRVYRLDPRQIHWRTNDHSLTQQLFDQGKLSEWEMGVHPEQNQLTRSINLVSSPWVDVHSYPPMQSGETFVLCTDGFWESVKESEWLLLAQAESGKAELKKIAQMAVLRAQGKSDNCTVQWVRKR